jgi:hypothetical protein
MQAFTTCIAYIIVVCVWTPCRFHVTFPWFKINLKAAGSSNTFLLDQFTNWYGVRTHGNIIYTLWWSGTWSCLEISAGAKFVLGYCIIRIWAIYPLHDIRLPSWYIWDMPSFVILRSLEWQFSTDVSGQLIGPIFRGISWPLKMGPVGCPKRL